MKCEWKQIRIGDLGLVITGKTPQTKNAKYWGGHRLFITPKDLQRTKHIFQTERIITDAGLESVKGCKLPARAVCVSCIGNIGYVGMTTQDCISNQQINSIVVNKDYDADYVYYVMRGLWPLFKKYEGSSTALSILNKSQFSNIRVRVVTDIKIQRRIATILSSLDDKIELNNKINANLEQQAQALFKAWFVGNSFNNKGTLGDIAEITMGQSPSGNSYNEDGKGSVFYQGRSEFGFRFPTRRLFTTEPKRMARAGDLLLSVRAPVGDLNVAYENCCIGRGLCALHSRDNMNSFLLYALRSLKPTLDVFNGEGTVFGSISKDDLVKIPVSIPCVDDMARFEAIVRPMDDLIRANYEANCRLQVVRDNLLPKLMSGEISLYTN